MDTNTKLETVTATLSSHPPRWRANLLSIFQLVGVLLAVLGSGELLGLFSVFDPELSKKLALAGPAIIFAAKPFLCLLGDFLDDGQRNNSFKLETVSQKEDPNQGQLPLGLFIVGILSAGLVSCAVRVNPDGSKDASVDPKAALKILQVLSEK